MQNAVEAAAYRTVVFRWTLYALLRATKDIFRHSDLFQLAVACQQVSFV